MSLIKKLLSINAVVCFYFLENVNSGRYSYLHFKFWKQKGEYLKIENSVSIDVDVIFMVDRNHQIDVLSTLSFKAKFFGERNETLTKSTILKVVKQRIVLMERLTQQFVRGLVLKYTILTGVMVSSSIIIMMISRLDMDLQLINS